MIYNQSPLTVPTYITAGEPVNASVVNRLVQNSNGLVTRVTESSNNLTVISGNSNVTITANQDVLILCNNTTNITVTLPPASTQYKRIAIKKTANNTNTVTIQRAGSDTIEDPTNPLTTPIATSYVLLTVDSQVTYVSSGNTWRVADFYSPPVFCRVYTTNNQNINGDQKIYFNVSEFNVNNFFSVGTTGTTSRFQPLIAGYYELNSQVLYQDGTSTRLGLLFKKQTTLINESGLSTSAGYQVISANQITYMNGSTDYIEIFGTTLGGITRIVMGQNFASYFTAKLL